MSKNKSLSIVLFAYSLCFITFIFVLKKINYGIFYDILIVDVIATVIIYFFSFYFKNSSIYDPYWSVIPPIILFYFIYIVNEINFQAYLLLFSVFFWGLRLTFNWMRSWPGMHHEDWRYIDMRKSSGKYFQFSNFFGIHLFPTLIVFACCIPMYDALNKQIDVFTYFGFSLCFIGVLYEIISDQQLYNFKKNNTGIINSGLWKYSRHPNYYGEILFWWGIYFYGVSSGTVFNWIFAPIAMTIMFLYVSIPWIENKIIKTRPKYLEYKNKVSVLSPEFAYIRSLFK
tara:strand:+ start:639 stop:1493 length:855 start_codon:yes stop_codon:yes gene_type:complete